MNQYNIPGLAIGLVKNDAILYSKGYGVANIINGKPISENSIFHTGSISKLFTAMAIMQLVANDKLSLDNKLIEIIIPTITLKINTKIKRMVIKSQE